MSRTDATPSWTKAGGVEPVVPERGTLGWISGTLEASQAASAPSRKAALTTLPRWRSVRSARSSPDSRCFRTARVDPFSLYNRMREHGTLAETPSDVPDARFALPSTINWMRALAILVSELKLDFASARDASAKVQRRALSERELNSVCEQLLFALHQLAALRAIATVENKADVARIGIMAWYYGVYGAASAMIAAGDGAFPETHAATAQQWDRRHRQLGAAGWRLMGGEGIHG